MQPGAYLPQPSADCPTFSGDSEWTPLVDGRAYFTELDAALTGLGPGDAVLVAGLELDPMLDLSGRAPGEPAHAPLGDRLIAIGRAGADVRVLLAGKVSAQHLPFPALRGFRQNVRTAHRLDEAGLRGCVLVDWSGRLLGSHHQKVVVVSRSGVLTAFVGGIDLIASRLDAAPHDRMRLRGRPWGWHDAAVRVRGPAANQVHLALTQRWREAASLPARRYVDPLAPGRVQTMNPASSAPPLDPPPVQPSVGSGAAVRVLRSMGPWRIDSPAPWRRRRWTTLPRDGYQEIHETLTTAIDAACRYVYVEDQYLGEEAGGNRRFELYDHLRAAAARGVKVVLVGSGTRDPDDPGLRLRPINRVLNRDLRRKVVDPLPADHRDDVAVFRVVGTTVHSKIVLVDDVFGCIGSANMFSRSMAGVDCELAVAVADTGAAVRELRVRLWAEHLRLTDGESGMLTDLDAALGIWDARWASGAVPSSPSSALRSVR